MKTETPTLPLSPPTPAKGWQQIFASLDSQDFRWFWVGMLNYFTAMTMEAVARGWLVYRMTDSALALGIITAAWGLPVLFLAPFGGVVTDRVNKRNLLIITEGLIGLVVLSLTILLWTGAIQFWHLVVGVLCTGSISAFNMPVRQALVPELVAPVRLMNAVALNSSGMNLTRIAGPALAGVLVTLVDVQGIYAIMVANYAICVVSLLRMSNNYRGRSGLDTGYFADLGAGLGYLWGHRLILLLLVLELALVLFGMPYQSFMPVFAVKVFGVGAEGLGLLLSAAGVGALVGSLSIASLGNFQRKGALLLLLGLVFSVSLVLFAHAPNLYLGLGLLVSVGLGGTGYFAVNNTLILSNVTPEMRGRVMSIYMVTFGMMPFAALPAGALVQALGAPFTVTIGGLVLTAVLTSVALFAPALRRQP